MDKKKEKSEIQILTWTDRNDAMVNISSEHPKSFADKIIFEIMGSCKKLKLVYVNLWEKNVVQNDCKNIRAYIEKKQA
jgi:hypothetical protein